MSREFRKSAAEFFIAQAAILRALLFAVSSTAGPDWRHAMASLGAIAINAAAETEDEAVRSAALAEVHDIFLSAGAFIAAATAQIAPGSDRMN